MSSDASGGIGTRTRTRAAQAKASSVAAANIRQATRSTRVATISQDTRVQTAESRRQTLSEDQQKESVRTVFETRQKLVEWELKFVSELESEGFELISSENAHEQYALVKSMRRCMDTLCDSLARELSEAQTAHLRDIIKFVQSFS
jgi:hypothetical protein